ncbi:conserved repeat domain-containing protein [Cohnella sp. OV330]|uniref:COG1470 family protein n=1 Tax=Cohnella sp. OV330 TaxID=1855288 RepID=UPI0008E45336|nr:NEW3 domain-containing protein [Cohnella sp. OV330]SFB19579.1 conserved repeat domain-containing protein [Cohnella sp. OV330]
MFKPRLGKWASFATTLLMALGVLGISAPVSAAGTAKLYTPYVSLSAAPGESITYDVDLINDGDGIQTAALSYTAPSKDWKTDLTAGGHPISEVAVKPHESQTASLSVLVPFEVAKGSYALQLNAGAFGSLTLKINVTEQGTYKTELSAEQPNMEGHSDSTFTYNLTLANRTASKQQYALTAEPPAGWDARFSSGGNNVTAVDIEPNATSSITLTLTPSEKAEANTYKIPVHAANSSTSADVTMEAVITGTYGIDLTTSNQVLSANVTAGGKRTLELAVKNTGTAELTNVSLTNTAPTDWEVTFEPKTIPSIKAGESVPVTATIHSSDKSLSGDYVVGLTAQAAEKSADAAIRVTVKTSVLWGWIGVLIILVVLAGVYWLFRKYGRR